MSFRLELVPSAREDPAFFTAREQRIILRGIDMFLSTEADIEGRRRKRLRPNPVAPWALRIGNYRVFYEIRTEQVAVVLAIGHKLHNDLFVRGRRIEI